MDVFIQNITGTEHLTDRVLATDLLFATKTGIINDARALSEAATPEVRQVLKNHLNESIHFHARVFTYMVNKGWYNPYNAEDQIKMDMKYSETALNRK
ncbi:spore coat protein [Paenibacillus xerothermodurans]|uniref:Spore coat protein n=1 Tax=Paenibacillus xerothermodurans TaxID=1977292 RepID=A0A2W1P4R7_PAEXE|nr:spore coat protein [Paenibacillus xerothermodurans]PZE22148.1 spore coat protein [Paenibacillus xerothermodurans]